MLAYVFPGQGSQYKGMGEGLFSQFPEMTSLADSILGYSIEKLCMEDPEQLLNYTQFTQPALFVVNALTYLSKLQEDGITPHFFAGHSLGEYNCLFAADVFDFKTGLELVKKRGQLMSQNKKGVMVAIIGVDLDTIKKIIAINSLKNIEISNYNSYTQVVISGLQDEIEKSKPYFEDAGASFIPLKVSASFHSSFMQNAQQQFNKFIYDYYFSAPKITIISNVTANKYEFNNIQSNLINQISSPVHWTQTIEYLISQGVSEFIEIGPGNILTGLIKRIKVGL